jgi:SAM-dependent methyltransferase
MANNNIIDCYNKAAKNYANKFIDELNKKHFDRLLLQAFAKENLGCGPGQTTAFLFNLGFTNIVGTDVAPGMIDVAKEINPQLNFEVADMLKLHFDAHSFGSAIAFYAIVHFTYEELATAFNEIKRVLIKGGQCLFSFHVGDQIVHHDIFLEQKVDINFHFFDTQKVVELLTVIGFTIIDVIERQLYTAIEYPSKRAYIWIEK